MQADGGELSRLEGAKAGRTDASLVHDFDECWLIVIRGLEPMKVHDGRRNVGQAGVREVRPEPDPRGKPRTSYGDWNLHIF